MSSSSDASATTTTGAARSSRPIQYGTIWPIAIAIAMITSSTRVSASWSPISLSVVCASACASFGRRPGLRDHLGRAADGHLHLGDARGEIGELGLEIVAARREGRRGRRRRPARRPTTVRGRRAGRRSPRRAGRRGRSRERAGPATAARGCCRSVLAIDSTEARPLSIRSSVTGSAAASSAVDPATSVVAAMPSPTAEIVPLSVPSEPSTASMMSSATSSDASADVSDSSASTRPCLFASDSSPRNCQPTTAPTSALTNPTYAMTTMMVPADRRLSPRWRGSGWATGGDSSVMSLPPVWCRSSRSSAVSRPSGRPQTPPQGECGDGTVDDDQCRRVPTMSSVLGGSPSSITVWNERMPYVTGSIHEISLTG